MISGECAWGAFIKGAKKGCGTPAGKCGIYMKYSLLVDWFNQCNQHYDNTHFKDILFGGSITLKFVFGMLDNGFLLVFKIFNMPTFFTYFVSPVMEIICYACPYYDGPLVEKCTLLGQNCKKKLSTMVFLFLYVLHKFVIMLWIAALQMGNWTGSVE